MKLTLCEALDMAMAGQLNYIEDLRLYFNNKIKKDRAATLKEYLYYKFPEEKSVLNTEGVKVLGFLKENGVAI